MSTGRDIVCSIHEKKMEPSKNSLGYFCDVCRYEAEDSHNTTKMAMQALYALEKKLAVCVGYLERIANHNPTGPTRTQLARKALAELKGVQ